ncbi:MAG: Maf family protein [Solirubrobacteraceae bacterium]
MAAARLILASASPQRRAILEQIGVAFEVRIPNADELADGPAVEVALENAFRKASTIAPAELPVLGVDTVVSLGRRIFGKPRDAADAAQMLETLAGRTHVVVSGVCLLDGERVRTAAAQTAVEFRTMDRPMVDGYVRTGEWQGRAGAYAIQGRGATLVNRIEGDYLNVVGLPVPALLDLAPELIAD